MVSTVADTKSSHTLKQQALQIAQQMSQECVARRLRQVNRTVTRLYDEALRPHGLTVNQLNILAVVTSEQQIRPGQLAQTLGMEKSTVSRTIDRMVGKGWLKVTPGKDSRTQILSMTQKGNQLLLTVTPVWDTLQTDLLATGGDSILNMLVMREQPKDKPTSESDHSYPNVASTELIYTSEPVAAEDFYL